MVAFWDVPLQKKKKYSASLALVLDLRAHPIMVQFMSQSTKISSYLQFVPFCTSSQLSWPHARSLYSRKFQDMFWPSGQGPRPSGTQSDRRATARMRTKHTPRFCANPAHQGQAIKVPSLPKLRNKLTETLYTIALCTTSALTCPLLYVKLLTGYGGSSSNHT
jgi:hypothetical protein